ncbi:glycosyltransferase family 2 protein [Microbacterium lushaniae]|uniref:4,4'-diaponeurosporenoate glycosyltransferase n=1 Tax=Microbacterium lushaniae TaxID=2614639 RepID=A0A5J6L323_9MICO|nr:glycosyltransferase family 2 protein [Microbacterium lushaniae]
MTRVSVVIPVKDDAAVLRRCLRALALQTQHPDEVVVVDNGSSDDSATVARDAGARVVPCRRRGIPAASACGYDAAIGDIILRLDADCLPAVTWVQTMAAAFERHPRVGAFTGGARFVDGPRRLRAPLAAVYLGAYTAVAFSALGHLPLYGSNLGFRRDVWRRVRGSVHLSPGIHDDFDLAFHIGIRYPIRFARDAAMGVSMRPFGDPRAFAVRTIRGVLTVVLHWPQDFPPVRWVHLVMRRALDGARAGRCA